MSAKVFGKVWDIILSPAKQSVLLALADHADHDGGSVKPGVPLIAWKTGYSERQVRRIMQDLETDGILVPVLMALGKPTVYRIDLGKGIPKPPFEARKKHKTPDKMSPPDPRQDVTPDKMSPLTSQGKDVLQTPDIASAKTSSIRHKEEPTAPKDIAPGGASADTDIADSSMPPVTPLQPPSMASDGDLIWLPALQVPDDDLPERYPCSAADVNALIGAWWYWVPLRPTKRGKVVPAAQHYANATNRDFAQNLIERGVNPSDFIDCLGDIRVDPNHPQAYLRAREMTFCYAAEVVESWVRDVRSLDFYTADCPRILPRKPGLVIDLGELAGLTSAELWARYAEHPDVIVDVPPAYLSPHALAEDDFTASVPLDHSRLALIAQEFPL